MAEADGSNTESGKVALTDLAAEVLGKIGRDNYYRITPDIDKPKLDRLYQNVKEVVKDDHSTMEYLAKFEDNGYEDRDFAQAYSRLASVIEAKNSPQLAEEEREVRQHLERMMQDATDEARRPNFVFPRPKK